jgi:nucleotide-binding universal stress UspA family protein
MSAERPCIVVGLDGSPRAAGVLAAAIREARAFHGELVLVRAVGIPVELPSEALSMPPANLTTTLTGIAELDLARLAADVPPDVPMSRHVRIGVGWQAVVEEATQRHADLIVIGSHGYAGLDRLLGTTAAKVVNHAPCSTLVVR